MKPVTVYWACGEDEWIRASKPETVSKRFYDQKIMDKDFRTTIAVNYCPAINTALDNLYAIKSIYDYSFTVKDGQCTSDLHDQLFFDKHVVLRSIEKKVFSFVNQYVFFTDEPSLKITAYEHPTFEQTEISKRCMPIPGTYDIGKWFRPLEFPFILKDEFDTFTVDYQDVLYYLRFHTERPIIFKQFVVTDKLNKALHHSAAAGKFKTRPFMSLDAFYNLFKSKNYVLKEIQDNLVQ